MEFLLLDLLIKGGQIIDGTANRPFQADLGIKGQLIIVIGETGSEARVSLEAGGLFIAPGFIDTHVHTDAALLNDPIHQSGLQMGVTTEILCQDGLSYAPLDAENYHQYSKYLSGLYGYPPQHLDMSSISSFRSHYHRNCSVNTVSLVPHSALRLSTVGFNDVPLIGKSLASAKTLLREGMEQGAVGMSTGLGFFPAAYATTEELVQLAEVVKDMDGVFVIQYRFFNFDRSEGLSPVAEALEIARRSGVKLHIAHYRTTPDNPGGTTSMMAELDKAKSEGVDLTADIYPYSYGSTMPVCRFPGWFVEGGPESIKKNLMNSIRRRRVVKFLEKTNGDALGDTIWSFIGSKKNHELEGQSWLDIAKYRGTSVAEMMCDILLEEDLQCGLSVKPPINDSIGYQIESDVMRLLDRTDYMVGSDSIPLGDHPHPRTYGTFPKILGRLRRRYGTPIEQIIQRMTSNPAQRFKLSGRGEIRSGNFADLVIFDGDLVNDRATFDNSLNPSVGIRYVLVNGQLSLKNGNSTGVLAGESIP